jgi:hypothetical protein
VYNYIYFVSKPEIGLHILSHLKPENLEKPKKNKKQYSGTLWEGPQLQNQQKTLEKTKNKKYMTKQLFRIAVFTGRLSCASTLANASCMTFPWTSAIWHL